MFETQAHVCSNSNTFFNRSCWVIIRLNIFGIEEFIWLSFLNCLCLPGFELNSENMPTANLFLLIACVREVSTMFVAEEMDR